MIGVLFYMKSAVVFPVVFYLNYHGNTNKKSTLKSGFLSLLIITQYI
jgi:hypothetical protein